MKHKILALVTLTLVSFGLHAQTKEGASAVMTYTDAPAVENDALSPEETKKIMGSLELDEKQLHEAMALEQRYAEHMNKLRSTGEDEGSIAKHAEVLRQEYDKEMQSIIGPDRFQKYIALREELK